MSSSFHFTFAWFSRPMRWVVLSALFFIFSGKAFSQAPYIVNADETAAQINPPPPTPDNVWFKVRPVAPSVANLLYVNYSPDYMAFPFTAFWENVAWYSETGAQLAAEARGVKDDLFGDLERSLILRTLRLENVRLTTSDVLFLFKGNSSNHVTSITLDNSTFFANGLDPTLDPSTFELHATNGNSTITNWVAQLNPDSALITVDSGASLTFDQCRTTEYPNNSQRLAFQSANNHAEVNGTLILKNSYLSFPTSIDSADDGFAIRPGGRLSLTGFYTTLEAQKLTIQEGAMDLNNNTFVKNEYAVLSNATVSIQLGALWSVDTLMRVEGNNTITEYNTLGVNPQSVRVENMAFENAATTLTLAGKGLFEIHNGYMDFNGGTLHVADSNTFSMYDSTLAASLPWSAGTLLVDPAAVFNINNGSFVSIQSGFQLTNDGIIDVFGRLKADGAIDGSGRVFVWGGGSLYTRGTGSGMLMVSNSLSLLANSRALLTISPSTPSSDRIVVGSGGTGLTIDPAAQLFLSTVNDVHLSAPTNFILFDYANFLGPNARFAGYSNGALFALGLNAYRIIYNDTTVPTVGGYAISLYSQFSVYSSYWSINSGGAWTTNPDWGTVGTSIGVAPGLDGANSIFDTATFDTRGLTSGTGTVTLTTNASLTGILFSNSAASYQVAGNGTINMTKGNTDPSITNNAGNHSIDTKLNFTTNVNIQSASGTGLTLGGAIIGSGGLTKSGEGTVNLTGTSTYSGPTIITGGALQLIGTHTGGGGISVVGGVLGGTGSTTSAVTVSGGGVTPGRGTTPGTLSVGSLQINTGGAFNVLISSPTDVGQLQVSGPAVVGGTLNAIPVSGWNLNFGDRYQIMTAGGGISGAFGTISVPQGYRGRFLVENGGGTGVLLIAPQSFTQLAVTPNQKGVASALNSFISATSGDRMAVGIALDSLTTGQFSNAFEQIMPGFYESLANIAIEQTYNQSQLLSQRLGTVRLGAQGFQAIGLSQPIKYDKDGKSTVDAKTASPIVESAISTHWNAWVVANGEFSMSSRISGVPNYKNNAGGFLVGTDYRLGENFVAGLFTGYEYSYAKYNGGSSTAGNSALFGLYGSYTHEDGYYADAIVSGGYTGFQTRRSIQFGTIDRTASADPNSGQFSAALNLGKDFEIGKFTLGPIIGAQYTYAGIGAFTETGADSLDLALGQQNANSLRTNLGARLAYNWEVGSHLTLIPELRGFWMHEFLNNPRNISSALDGGSGASFDYETSAPYRNSVFGGVGLSAKFGDRWTTSIFYNVNFGAEGYTNNIVSTSLSFAF